jgi:hypothetical protein|tara:strand:+ start:729 stop:893 length:165 start_codon:yes stop_codon:yes gene_type:complete
MAIKKALAITRPHGGIGMARASMSVAIVVAGRQKKMIGDIAAPGSLCDSKARAA